MAALPTNLELLVSGFLRQAKAKPDGVAWLTQLHSEAFAAVTSGSVFITGTSSAEGGHTAVQEMPAQVLLQIYEVCLQRLEAEDKAAQGIFAAPGTVRHADFSFHPCTLG